MATKRKHKAYTLWQKWRNTGWKPAFTVREESEFFNPIYIIEKYMKGWPPNFWIRGKTWMIKPEGEVPAGLG